MRSRTHAKPRSKASGPRRRFIPAPRPARDSASDDGLRVAGQLAQRLGARPRSCRATGSGRPAPGSRATREEPLGPRDERAAAAQEHAARRCAALGAVRGEADAEIAREAVGRGRAAPPSPSRACARRPARRARGRGPRSPWRRGRPPRPSRPRPARGRTARAPRARTPRRPRARAPAPVAALTISMRARTSSTRATAATIGQLPVLAARARAAASRRPRPRGRTESAPRARTRARPPAASAPSPGASSRWIAAREPVDRDGERVGALPLALERLAPPPRAPPPPVRRSRRLGGREAHERELAVGRPHEGRPSRSRSRCRCPARSACFRSLAPFLLDVEVEDLPADARLAARPAMRAQAVRAGRRPAARTRRRCRRRALDGVVGPPEPVSDGAERKSTTVWIFTRVSRL